MVDIGEHKVHKFGDGGQAIFLVYDGSHYNVGAVQRGRTEDSKVVKFQADEVFETEKLMLNLAQELKDKGEYIDPNLFALKCADCGLAMQGQIDAVEHAKSTGHSSFTQVEGSQIFESI